MTKKTIRKGVKISLPLVEVWYERIEEIRKDVKKMSKKSFFKRTKPEKDLAQNFVDFLMHVERGIESILWQTKGFAVRNELGKEVDYDFHDLFSDLIRIFNETVLKFDTSKINEKLLDHLKREIGMLERKASNLWNFQSFTATPTDIERAKNEIKTFRSGLLDFHDRMRPYFKEEEKPKEI